MTEHLVSAALLATLGVIQSYIAYLNHNRNGFSRNLSTIAAVCFYGAAASHLFAAMGI